MDNEDKDRFRRAKENAKIICDTQNDPEVNEPRAMRKAAMNETNGHRRNTIPTKDSEPRRKFRHIPTEINGKNWDGKSSEKWNRNKMIGRS